MPRAVMNEASHTGIFGMWTGELCRNQLGMLFVKKRKKKKKKKKHKKKKKKKKRKEKKERNFIAHTHAKVCLKAVLVDFLLTFSSGISSDCASTLQSI